MKIGSLSTDEWHYVEIEGKNTHGNGGHIILIFDTLPKGATVRYSNFIYEIKGQNLIPNCLI
jgi:hypothetical protein